MKVVFDTTVLLQLIDPTAKPPQPPKGFAQEDARAKLDHLLRTLTEEAATAIIPSPCLAELLTKGTGGIGDLLNALSSAARFIVESFDTRAAVECGLILRKHWAKRGTSPKNRKSRHAVKFDHQIVAIAKVQNADVIYSDDDDVRKLAAVENIATLGTWDLPSPPVDPQGELPLLRPMDC